MTTIVVTAAVVEREGYFLVTRRLKGTHLAGTWEFPGGKCDPGESLHDCMQRELLEELAARCRVGDEVFTISHQYDDRIVELHFFACTLLDEPRPQLGQQMQWVPRAQLRSLDFPPADAELIEKLSLER